MMLGFVVVVATVILLVMLVVAQRRALGPVDDVGETPPGGSGPPATEVIDRTGPDRNPLRRHRFPDAHLVEWSVVRVDERPVDGPSEVGSDEERPERGEG